MNEDNVQTSNVEEAKEKVSLDTLVKKIEFGEK